MLKRVGNGTVTPIGAETPPVSLPGTPKEGSTGPTLMEVDIVQVS